MATALEVVPTQLNMLRGAAQSLSLQLLLSDGSRSAVGSATWSSGAEAIASVSGSGPSAVITGQGRGTTTITARTTTSAGTSLSASAVVLVRDVISVTLLPDTLRLQVGSGGPVTATVSADTGVARGLRWSSANASIATVDSAGRVTGVSAGTTQILAAAAANDKITGRSVVVVSDPPPVIPQSVRLELNKASVCAGGQLSVTATPLDALGQAMSTAGLIVVWTATNATVTPIVPPQATAFAAGVSTAAVGGAQVTARVSRGTAGASSTAALQVLPPISRVDVTLSSTSIAVGQTAQGIATVRDCEGASLSGKTINWASARQDIATVTSAGVITGVAAGIASITATVDGVIGSAAVTVTPPPVDPVAQIVAVSGTSLANETIFGRVIDPPAVRLVRQSGAVAANEPVTFAVVTGGGTVAPGTKVTTDAAGIARLASWTLGGTLGTQSVTAKADAFSTVISFTAAALAPVFNPEAQVSTCRAQVRCAFALTLLNNRNQPLPGVSVGLVADAVPQGSSFEHQQLTTDAAGYIASTWFLPERKVYTGRATVGPTSAVVTRQATQPNFTASVVQGVIEKLQRGATPVKVGGLTVTLTRRQGGSFSSQQSNSAGLFDSGDIPPGTYDGVIPVSVGVVRAVRFFNWPVAGGQIINVGSLRVAQGTAGGPLRICLVGPLNTDPATTVTAFDGSGGDGSEAGRASVSYSPDNTGCFDGSLQEGEYMVRVQRTGKADFRIPLIVDTGTFPAPTKTFGIP